MPAIRHAAWDLLRAPRAVFASHPRDPGLVVLFRFNAQRDNWRYVPRMPAPKAVGDLTWLARLA
jgi:hypothetical protein